MSQKEISSRFYKKRKDNGLCPTCGKPIDREGHYCKSCAEKHTEYTRETRNFYRENGLCTVCGKEKVFGDEKRCPECRAKCTNRIKLTSEQIKRYYTQHNEYQKSLYEQRKEQGICTRCGKRKAIVGKTQCGICLQKEAERKRRKSYDKVNIREYRLNNRLCFNCGSPLDSNKKICLKCLEEATEHGKMARNNKSHWWRKDNRLIFQTNIGGKR